MKLHIIVFFLVNSSLSFSVFNQGIRWHYTEFTESRIAAYRNVIDQLISSGEVDDFASYHADPNQDGTNGNAGGSGDDSQIHFDDEFLPWHRWFLVEFERRIQDYDNTLTIPYLDWHQTWSSTSLLFQNSGGSNTGLLGYNVSASVWEDAGTLFNRNFNTSLSQPSDNYSNIQTFGGTNGFAETLRLGAHNNGHQFVGGGGLPPGDMVLEDSPIDPVFYIHHAMVNKAWWDWRESFPTESVSVLNSNMQTFNGYSTSTANGQALVDSKSFGVWYAYNNLLRIEDFDFTQDQVFKYSTESILIDNVDLSSTTDMDILIKQGSAYSITIEGPFEAPQGSTLSIDTF